LTDYSGRTDLAVGDIAELGALIDDGYVADTGGVTKGQAVYVSGSGKVKPTTVSAEIAIGIALKTCAAGVPVPILKHGKVKVTAGGAISAGGTVRGSTSGKVIANPYAADITMVDKNLGYRVETTDTVADGDLILIEVTK
jgi:hypothetical protein